MPSGRVNYMDQILGFVVAAGIGGIAGAVMAHEASTTWAIVVAIVWALGIPGFIALQRNAKLLCSQPSPLNGTPIIDCVAVATYGAIALSGAVIGFALVQTHEPD